MSKKILLEHAHIEGIRFYETYRKNGGYRSVEKALKMSPDEIVDLLQGGQGVFGIAIGKVWSEVEGSLSLLQGENLKDGSLVVSGESNDELAQRRKLKGA